VEVPLDAQVDLTEPLETAACPALLFHGPTPCGGDS